MSLATKPLALDETLVRVADALGGGSVQTQSRFENVNKSIAPLFDSTQTYATDSLVMHDDKLYKCTTAHTGAWDETHFVQTNVVSEGGSSIAIANNAGAHNGVFRGQSLGSSVTAEQYAAIQAGTFDDMYIGDYWTINGVVYRIAHFDYWLNTAGLNNNTTLTDHHVVLVPDNGLYTAPMNDTNTTTGGYVGSKMYTTNLADAKTTINTAFGSTHILTHKEYLYSAVSSGVPSSGGWFASTVELMTEQMVYGGYIYEPGSIGASTAPIKQTYDYIQLALFRLAPAFKTCNVTYWLRNVGDSEKFAGVFLNGRSLVYYAGNTTYTVRPVFAIYSPIS